MLLLALFTALFVARCRCASGTALASLVRAHGSVERDHAARSGDYGDASPGAEFQLGDSLRTGAGAAAEVLLGNGGRVELSEHTLLRFSASPPGDPGAGLDVETGVAILEAGETELRLHTRFGSAMLASKARLRIAPNDRGTSLEVVLGTARFETRDGVRDVQAGHTLEIAIGGAVLEHLRHDTPPPNAPPAPAPAQSPKTVDVAVQASGPGYTDILAQAGMSFVVHDPQPPTAVGFPLDGVCKNAAVIERLNATGNKVLASARGQGSVSLLFPTSTHRYRVPCEDQGGGPTLSGTIIVVRDSGDRSLSRVPPMTRIDTDGRSYTVTYQNLLPKIAVRWQGAPKADRYTLSIESRLGKRTVASRGPTHTFAAGQLAEDKHLLQFSAGKRLSPQTKLMIRFENAAPTARISSPRDRAFQASDTVTVAGVAIPGWFVDVSGRAIPLDDQSRFSEQVTLPTGQRAIQLRFVHPQRGIHYYLRRAVGVSP